ncbi:uncharacterized protein LOC133973109 isoform X2 [Platichthys flesus]|uniref:uncharacterized protein LOC133973109 isoform X2 n=1 Tax=Platichthys flesus TaxID=8260 RepID=UPI002DB7AFF4|nr:uncharacterized protein LOC133973109 isoform X2 [Platichthys flesus]
MKAAAFVLGFMFTCAGVPGGTAGGHLEGLLETGVLSECRDRYLWVQVASVQTPRFEAVDENGVHPISELLASRCGYTISTFKMDGFTTFRASYYSCFTHIQNDEVFTFRFNVIMSDSGGGWISRPVSATCSGLTWTHREVVCEEDYMEVNVNRESSCGGQRGESGQVWQTAFSQALMTASSVWQLMFLQSDGRVSSMSISEAQTQGYGLTTTSQRVVLRSQYKQQQASLVMVEGVPVEVIQVSVFLKKKLMVVMMDVSMSCAVNSGSFDGASLLWDVPWIMMPLVEEDARFESQTVSVGVEGVLLDQPTARGFSLVRIGGLVQIRVRFGAEGGYRQSVVLDNVYKERYVISLLYEHVFALMFEDNSSIITRHRILRVLDTPLICRPPFSVDKTRTDDEAFSVYLGNIPADVVLEEVWINGKQRRMSGSVDRGVSISPVSHVNGSRAYDLRLPFEDADVLWTYLGAGVVQYSVDMNFTLSIVHQRGSYHHHTFISARLFSAFPPQITAHCFDGGITFSVVRPPRAKSLWEVGVDHEPLTSQLAAQRGYRLLNDTHKTSLDVPVFSIGYTYEDINLSFFYGTFKLLLRDSKTLAVQTSTSKRCLFKTQDMTVCSADGTVTVVTTPASTWPTVRPDRTSLLDPTCRSKQTDGSRVLFEFNVNSCGTRARVGESYVVYENEIIHDKQLIADGPNFISRESQFKLTVRCFYPLSGVHRLSVSRVFRSPGFGSIEVFESTKDSANKVPARDCLLQEPGNEVNTPMNQAHLEPGFRPLLKPGPSHFITVSRQHNKVVSSSDIQTSPTLNLSPETQNQKVVSHPGRLKSKTEERNVFSPFSSFPRKPSFNVVHVSAQHSGPQDDVLASVLDSYSRTADSAATDQSESSWSSTAHTPTLTSLNSLDEHVQQLGQNGIKLNEDMQSLSNSNPSLHELKQKMSPQGLDDPSQLQLVLKPVHYNQDQISGQIVLPTRHQTLVPADTQESVDSQTVTTATSRVDQNPKRTESMGRRSIEMLQSSVKNIRVKPMFKLESSGNHLKWKPSIKQVNSQISNPGLMEVSANRNHRRSEQLHDRRPSITRRKTDFQTGNQEQGVYGVQGKLHQSEVIRLPDQSPTHIGPQQNLVQSGVETENHMREEPASALRTFVQSAGTTHIRVRPGPSGGLQTPDQPGLQNPDSLTRGGIGGTSDFSFILQNTVVIRELDPTNPNAQRTEGLNPTTGGTGLPGPKTSPTGSDPGSVLKIHWSSDRGRQYGSSVHRGIMRGEQIS